MLTACENTRVEWFLMGLVLHKADGRMGDAWSSGQHSVQQTDNSITKQTFMDHILFKSKTMTLLRS